MYLMIKSSRKSLGTTENEKLDYIQKGYGILNSYGGSLCTHHTEIMKTLKRTYLVDIRR